MVENINLDEAMKRLNWYESKYGPYIEKKGLHNWKNLFRKPTFEDWFVLFVLFMMFLVYLSYERDTRLCRDFLDNDYKAFQDFLNINVNTSESLTKVDYNLSNFLIPEEETANINES